ncbi:MAG: GNAT family N-acetyltransferase [Solirubrobacteraceae bacterium]
MIALISAAMDTYQQWCPGWRAPADLEDREGARWRIEDHATRWLVASSEQNIIGAARWVSGEPAVLSLLMVHPRNWRGGVGSALHDRALSEMSQGQLFQYVRQV